MKLHTENVVGNLHGACHTLNRWGLAEQVFSLHYSSGSYTIAVLKVHDDFDIDEHIKKYGKKS